MVRRRKNKEVRDPRSTGRKRGRAALFKAERLYHCAFCGRAPARIPPQATRSQAPPGGTWEGMATLQVNHINKNILDNDTYNLEWLCPSCHKIKDAVTLPGVSIRGDEFGYGLEI
jgi:hypothetical protein